MSWQSKSGVQCFLSSSASTLKILLSLHDNYELCQTPNLHAFFPYRAAKQLMLPISLFLIHVCLDMPWHPIPMFISDFSVSVIVRSERP